MTTGKHSADDGKTQRHSAPHGTAKGRQFDRNTTEVKSRTTHKDGAGRANWGSDSDAVCVPPEASF